MGVNGHVFKKKPLKLLIRVICRSLPIIVLPALFTAFIHFNASDYDRLCVNCMSAIRDPKDKSR